MTEQKYEEKVRKLEAINQEQFITILHLNQRIREMENMDKVRRLNHENRKPQ